MITVRKLLIVSMCLLSAVSIAQETKPKDSALIPVEVFFGNHRFATQVTVNRKFNQSTRLGVFASTMTAGDYDNKLNFKNQTDREKNDSESMNSLYLTYDVYQGLGIVAGAGINSSWGFRPFVGGRYGFRYRVLSVNMATGFYLTQSKNSESKAGVQFSPQLSSDWSFFTSVQAMYNHDMDTKKHDRAAVYGRLGVSYKAYGFGFAANLDWYGPNKVLKENYGLYLSYAF
mgnify:FL=1